MQQRRWTWAGLEVWEGTSPVAGKGGMSLVCSRIERKPEWPEDGGLGVRYKDGAGDWVGLNHSVPSRPR